MGAPTPGRLVNVLAQAAVPRDIGVFVWLFDPDSWTGSNGILASGWDTVVFCTNVIVI